MTNKNTNKQTQTNVRVSRHDQRQTHTNKCSSNGGIGLVILGGKVGNNTSASYPILHTYFYKNLASEAIANMNPIIIRNMPLSSTKNIFTCSIRPHLPVLQEIHQMARLALSLLRIHVSLFA